MSQLHQLQIDARSYAAEGQYLSSYISLREAAAEAKRFGDFRSTMICLINAYQQGGIANIKAVERFRLLLEIRALMHSHPDQVPVGLNINFRGGIQIWIFEHTASHTPRRDLLEQGLGDIRDAHISDQFSSRRRIHSMRGEWTEARHFSEQAWSNFLKPYVVPDCCSMLHKTVYALDVFADALVLEDREAAKQWLETAAKVLETHNCRNCKRNYLRSRVEFALAVHEPIAAVRAELAAARDQDHTIEAAYYTDYLSARVDLLDPDNGDPCASTHPARVEFCRRPSAGSLSVTERYGHATAVLDYRLAALRYATGLPPMDDYWPAPIGSSAPPPSPIVVQPRYDTVEVRRRLAKARHAANKAMRAAKTLDDMLECDWRQLAVKGRIERIEAISSALTPP